MANYSGQMQRIFAKYEKEVSADPSNLPVVGRWAIDHGLWEHHDEGILSQFSKDMAGALREEYRADENGRRYRAKHAVRTTQNGRQLSFWADIDKAPRSHMEKAFAQRRNQIVGDCHQLRLDVDHYNVGLKDEEPIQMILDFTDDVEELLILEDIGAKKAA